MSDAANTRTLHARKHIALVAHDHKKRDLIQWAIHNQETLANHDLYATGTTGTLLSNALGRRITSVLSGPLGGDQQIGAMIAEGKIDVLIFFWDPMEALSHDPDIKALLRMSAVWNIPVACNRSTADFLMTSPLLNERYEALLTDYSAYTGRKLS